MEMTTKIEVYSVFFQNGDPRILDFRIGLHGIVCREVNGQELPFGGVFTQGFFQPSRLIWNGERTVQHQKQGFPIGEEIGPFRVSITGTIAGQVELRLIHPSPQPILGIMVSRYWHKWTVSKAVAGVSQ